MKRKVLKNLVWTLIQKKKKDVTQLPLLSIPNQKDTEGGAAISLEAFVMEPYYHGAMILKWIVPLRHEGI